jgi:hypothetical protein
VDDKIASQKEFCALKLQRLYRARKLRLDIQRRVLITEDAQLKLEEESIMVLQKVVRGKLGRTFAARYKISGAYGRWKKHPVELDEETMAAKKFREDQEAFVVFSLIENKLDKQRPVQTQASAEEGEEQRQEREQKLQYLLKFEKDGVKRAYYRGKELPMQEEVWVKRKRQDSSVDKKKAKPRYEVVYVNR